MSEWPSVSFEKLWPEGSAEQNLSIYSQHWYRAVAVMLLSGRVSPTTDGWPNKTEGRRLCKEANFSPAWLDELGWFLAQADIVRASRIRGYAEGKSFDAFDQHDFEPLQLAVHGGVMKLIQEETGGQVLRPTPVGLLLIKPESDPANFVARCVKLGFDVIRR